jgi:hypothetical protein
MGYVYVFESQSFVNNWLKIGSTKDILSRLRAANNSFVPYDVDCIYAVEVEDAIATERVVHFAFRDYRKAKEFFEVPLGDVIKFCEGLQRLKVARVLSSEELDACSEPVFKDLAKSVVGKARQRAENTTFERLGIPVGSKLVFKDDTGKSCVSVDTNNQVQYGREKPCSISSLASGWKGYPVNGYSYFMYSDEEHGSELLWDRRVRLEAQASPAFQREFSFGDDPEED